MVFKDKFNRLNFKRTHGLLIFGIIIIIVSSIDSGIEYYLVITFGSARDFSFYIIIDSEI
jgi:hypothetical protein